MSTCTIGMLNVHNNERAARYMLRQRCDVLAFNEANRLTSLVASLKGYRAVVGTPVRDKRRSAAETPLLVRKQHRSLGSFAWRASELVQPERIAPDRWVTASAQIIDGFGPLAVVNVHPNAMTDGRTIDVARVRESAELWATVSRLLTFLVDEGLPVVLAGDVNARADHDTPGWAGAYDVIKQHELRPVTSGLDVIAFDRRLRLVEKQIVARHVHGSDHPAIIVELAPMSGKR